MRSARIKKEGTAVYHCMSRAVAGEMLLDDGAKEMLRRMLWEVADFSGVEVLAYCVMTNHFHVLVRVPVVAEPLTREEVLRRYRVLYAYSGTPGYPDASVLEGIFAEGGDWLVEGWMERLSSRMNDVSAFMKTLKQRFTRWYNKTHRRFGTLWAERFKSVLVQNDTGVLRTVAAYLDLNPVRASLVEDPADYRWCSYAEAMAGEVGAERGLAKVMGGTDWREVGPAYRRMLFGKGGSARKSGQGKIPEKSVEAIREKGGGVETCELLRCRQRFMTQGMILGSQEFVQAMGWALAPSAEGPSGRFAGLDLGGKSRINALLKSNQGPLPPSAPTRKASDRGASLPSVVVEDCEIAAWRD